MSILLILTYYFYYHISVSSRIKYAGGSLKPPACSMYILPNDEKEPFFSLELFYFALWCR